ncbi:para-aminobenzoate synthase glutamine amidotransferase component II [Oceanobacillus picturae]|uniref:Para-aminobenzoate synthase glutamine amidotransferase component II n=1 Tax=Oceanobacillus picturae TaxID=171693 RepID=A0A0U9H2K8_9BACI|nr:aminodeoxychorismate/anthranilate synthase component II [Oceanobacillus picturae]RIU91892.1 aminodeoxychorismate/anthranilate synthase component II [Oceanobacillus picturae]GAQ16571.1 para-aminobenzoate synthase glutamine amidotransferase component II [Oceanobacillus picturae]
MILLLDNYDSFTYNIYQYVSEEGEEVQVYRNDAISIQEVERLAPEAIILSPGPGLPAASGICLELVSYFHQKIPILGICLGHQAIAEALGGSLRKAKQMKHGKTSLITHQNSGLFRNLSQPLEVMRYHSYVVEKNTLPHVFEITAVSLEDGEIMAIKHQSLPLYGVQFHPESIGTTEGRNVIRNFLKGIREEFSYETISRETN